MTSLIFYSSSSGTYYELTATHEDEAYVPKFLSEDGTGVIADLSSDRWWRSLPEMTNDLKIEITDWNSDPGN